MIRIVRLAPKAALAALLLTAALTSPVHAQVVKLFADSPDTTEWIASWGAATGGSALTLVNGTHVPVITGTRFLGSNALRLAWTPAAAGDWALTVANANWVPFDTTPYDTLVFMLWSPVTLPAAELPQVFLEDQNNQRSPRRPMALFITGVTAGGWTRVPVPMSVIRAAPGPADLTHINKVFFGQGSGMTAGIARSLVLDEIRFVAAGLPAPATPLASSRSGERHVDVRWLPASTGGADWVRCERLDGASWARVGDAPAADGSCPDWRGAAGLIGDYRVTAIGADLRLSEPSGTVTAATRELSDDEWLDLASEAAFRYFWDHGHPVSGLARERYGSGQVCATGGTGMGILAILVAADRGWVPRADACARVATILDFFDTHARTFHGAYSHWLDGTTGAAIPFDAPDDSSMDIVETSYLIQGVLTARRYFDSPGVDEIHLREVATRVWERVDWNAFRPTPTSDAIDWLWSPKYGFSHSFALSGWNEAMIAYVLAKASPTHPIPASCYAAGWARHGAIVNGRSFWGMTLWVGPDYGGGLYLNQYTFMTLDPRFKRDTYANYEKHCRNAALIDRTYCALNPGGFAGYSQDVWGLTASDDPWGYSNRGPYSGDNGTLAPTAALGMMPFSYARSLEALKAMYRLYGDRLWGPFGFRDAFNPTQGWFAGSYIAIDQGPIVAMIENARTHLLWDRFMSNPEIGPALDSLGFVPDSSAVTAVPNPAPPAAALALAPPSPNPFSDATVIRFTLVRTEEAEVTVHGIDGRRIATLLNGPARAGQTTLRWDGRDARGRAVRAGVYLIRVRAGRSVATTRVERLR